MVGKYSNVLCRQSSSVRLLLYSENEKKEICTFIAKQSLKTYMCEEHLFIYKFLLIAFDFCRFQT